MISSLSVFQFPASGCGGRNCLRFDSSLLNVLFTYKSGNFVDDETKERTYTNTEAQLYEN